jgi:hypothetical protein
MTPAISFIVTAREETPAVLAATMDGLLKTSEGHEREIVLIDDASATPVEIERPGVRVVRNPVPIGVARSRCAGAEIASAPILGFCDAHMTFAPDWLAHMLAWVETGALLCAAWWNYELSKPVCWGSDFAWCGERDYKAGRAPGFVVRHRTKYPGEGAPEVPMALGACYVVLRHSYDRAGGFCPFFRTWGRSEQDISARMWLSGAGVRCVTAAHAGHMLAQVHVSIGALVAEGMGHGGALSSREIATWLADSRVHMWAGDLAPLVIPAPAAPKQDFSFYVRHALGPWTPAFWTSVYAAIKGWDLDLYLYGTDAVTYRTTLKIKSQAEADIARLTETVNAARHQFNMPFYRVVI